MPMGSISMCPNTLYMSSMDVGSSLRWLLASSMTQSHHFGSTSDPEPQNLSLLQWVNCLRLLLHAYGQHINVLKQFVYVKYGCVKQFEVAVSLNCDIMTSY
jgi:hypothetical protein